MNVGTVKTLNRFPGKWILGEHPAGGDITESGIVGDRAWGLVDIETGKVASAKHPRLWEPLLGLRATYDDEPKPGTVARIELGDGSTVSSDDTDVDERLSAAVGRDVHLTSEVPASASYDEEWPDVDGIAPTDFIAATRSGRSAA